MEKQNDLKEVYEALYSLVGAKKEDTCILTSSGVESVNHAVFSAYVDVTRKTGKNHFVCGCLDEAPVIMAMGRLSELDCRFEMAPANEGGVITAKAVAETLTPRTAMVSLSWANPLTGVIQPVAEIAKVCAKRGVLFHVEATHLLGKGYYTFESSRADLLSLDGLPGSGALFVREGLEVSAFILGGNEQEHRRAGRLSRSVLNAFGQKARETVRFRDHFCIEVARLRESFEQILGKGLFADQLRLPNISAHIFPGVTSDALAFLLHKKGVQNVTFGGNRLQHIMHILKACGVQEPAIHSSLSFCFSQETTEEEVEAMSKKVVDCVEELRKCSQYLMEEMCDG